MQLFTNTMAAMNAAQPRQAIGAKPDATGAGGSSSGSTNSASITANDFLQLLVTELQNQDPTANTDPNEYINQLVQVNSLEQLIQINQNLTSSSTAATGASRPVEGSAASKPSEGTAQTSASPTLAPGNLSVPAGGGASSRIADALGAAGQILAPGSGSSPLNSLMSSIRARAQQTRTTLSNPAQ
jgi:flagellar basal-body rod modification protein FlgD